jgi:FixJ family two-component response regulator
MSTPVVNVVDDDPAVSQAIAIVAKSLGYGAAVYRSAEDFLYGHDPERPGCLILDIKMPGMSGLELQKMLVDAGVCLPVIMISGHADISMAVTAMSRGAYTFLEKPFRLDVLQQQIRGSIEKDRLVRLKKSKRIDAQNRLARLTDKEQEVLDMIHQGLTNKQMAEKLNLTVRTVEDRRSRVMRKVEVNTLADLFELMFAVRDEPCV